MYCEVMKAKLLNQDELELGERTAISRKSETLISHWVFITVNCYLSFLLTILSFNEVILLSARSAEMFTHFLNF